MLELEGRVALVTGGAGGLGAALCRQLADLGADVAVADLPSSRDAAGAVADDVRSAGRRALVISADVTASADCEQMVQETVDELGGVDILMANAGFPGSAALAWEVREEMWDQVVDVCLKGVWLTTRWTVPHMIERGRGRIVLTSSRNGMRAETHCSPYVAAKHGVLGYMKALALELGPHHINVNAICPTSMGPVGGEWDPWWDVASGKQNTTLEEINSWCGKQDLFEKNERMSFAAAAATASWLVTDAAATVTGHALPIDDGWIAKRGG